VVKGRLVRFAFALGLIAAVGVPASISASDHIIYSHTKITIRNDTPNPAYVVFDFLSFANNKHSGWVGINGGTLDVSHSSGLPFLTHAHVYIKAVGQMHESAPTLCYAAGSYANSGHLGSDAGGGHFRVTINYDARNNTCWLGRY
jgi:hypothetical protein